MIWEAMQSFSQLFSLEVSSTMIANISMGVLWPYRSELLGGRKESSLARVDLLSGLALLGAAFTAPWTRAFARPLGTLLVGATRQIGYPMSLRSLYAGKEGQRESR